MTRASGVIRKMFTSYDAATGRVSYQLNLDEDGVVDLNELVGHEISISFSGNIYCVQCGDAIKKTFSGGYCYGCFITLAQTDMCILKPEQCHFHAGTCRDEAFGERHCFQSQTLYLARSSGIKVGITRTGQQLTRWMDQGAIEAMELGFFDDRLSVGQAEVKIAVEMSDKTNWRKMLKNDVTDADFAPYRDSAIAALTDEELEFVTDEGKTYAFEYPVQRYPEKVTSKKLDKQPMFTEVLQGIKGQYLILDTFVMNLRSHGGYHIVFEA
jgi:hypothetical protein